MVNDVTVIYKPVKNISLKVKPNLQIILIVPINTLQEIIDGVLIRRKKWISKQLEYFNKFKPVEAKELVSGESFLYLGRNYRLKVVSNDIVSVKLIAGYIKISLPDTNDYNKKMILLDKWYHERAEMYLLNKVNKYKILLNVEINNVFIRKMKTRWGSCNPNKSYINLNLELIKKSPYAIDYVILHELTHLIHYNHDRKFYNSLFSYMPDWQLRKQYLEKI